MKYLWLLTGLFLFFGQLVHSQTLKDDEQELFILFEQLNHERDDEGKDSVNSEITRILSERLKHELSFDYHFRSLKKLGIVKSPNRLLKLYTWNLFYADGTYKYFGFVQYRPKKRKAPRLYRLHDKSGEIENSQHTELTPQNWYGALYYDVAEKKYNRETIYTLMGWDGFDDFSNKKIIDVLRITNDGTLQFGMPIISYQDKIYHRLIFEFSEQSKMNLQYDAHYDMIIWDHLLPTSPSLEGQYEYYGPDFTQDGLFFEKNKWNYYPDIKPKNRN
ncbi:MAG: hypothetical protein U9N85_13215 [Bacteroidota bacterium]|nr:hypothetical protein [Bacteroidota bacterium]